MKMRMRTAASTNKRKESNILTVETSSRTEKNRNGGNNERKCKRERKPKETGKEKNGVLR